MKLVFVVLLLLVGVQLTTASKWPGLASSQKGHSHPLYHPVSRTLAQGTQDAKVAEGEVEDNAAPVASLAADLALIAARLAETVSNKGGSLPLYRHRRRHRPQRPALVLPSTQHGIVTATDLDYKGHKITMVTMKNDEFVGSWITSKNEPWQKHLLGPLMDFITPGSTVVDAGANMGAFSVFFAAHTGPSGRVYSFEPQARMFQLLCTNMMVNSLLNMIPKNMALSYAPEVLHMAERVTDGSSMNAKYTDVDGNATSVVNYGGMRLGKGGEVVQAVTLDSFNLTNVSLIKVDVQGAEQLMFYGAQETIKRNMPVVAFEVESGMAQGITQDLKLPAAVKAFKIEAFLADLGYSQPAVLQSFNDQIWVPPNHPWLETPAATVGALQGRKLLHWWPLKFRST